MSCHFQLEQTRRHHVQCSDLQPIPSRQPPGLGKALKTADLQHRVVQPLGSRRRPLHSGAMCCQGPCQWAEDRIRASMASGYTAAWAGKKRELLTTANCLPQSSMQALDLLQDDFCAWFNGRGNTEPWQHWLAPCWQGHNGRSAVAKTVDKASYS